MKKAQLLAPLILAFWHSADHPFALNHFMNMVNPRAAFDAEYMTE
jgi:hypothetical protein